LPIADCVRFSIEIDGVFKIDKRQSAINLTLLSVRVTTS